MLGSKILSKDVRFDKLVSISNNYKQWKIQVLLT